MHMAPEQAHRSLVLLASLLLLACSSLAQPNCSDTDTLQELSVGLGATHRYVKELKTNESFMQTLPDCSPMPNTRNTNSSEELLGHLCDVLAYYYSANNTNFSLELQYLLRENMLDTYNWLNKTLDCTLELNDITCSGQAQLVDKKLCYIGKYCLRRKLLHITESPVSRSKQEAARTSECAWMKKLPMDAPQITDCLID